MKPLSHVTDPRMVKALAHPVRVQILGELENGPMSPTQIAHRLGSPVPNISYHVRKLESLGVLKLSKEVRRRGAIEHYFEVQTRPSVRGEAWESTPDVVKEAFLTAMLGNISRQVNAAAASDGFDNDSHVSRLPLELDKEGYLELGKLYEELIDRARDIEKASKKRLDKADHEGSIASLAVLMLFETADDDEDVDEHSPRERVGGRSRASA